LPVFRDAVSAIYRDALLRAVPAFPPPLEARVSAYLAGAGPAPVLVITAPATAPVPAPTKAADAGPTITFSNGTRESEPAASKWLLEHGGQGAAGVPPPDVSR
jgi:hypothetical protein